MDYREPPRSLIVFVGHYKDRAQADKALKIFKSHEPAYKSAYVTK